jgi:CheY-like chemotaxis protein
MSHEIRTPMNAILGMLKLLQNTDLTVRQLDYAAKTEGAARSLLGLLNDVLDYSKVEAGKMTLDPRPFRLDRLMRDLSVILSANVGARNIEVLFDVDPAVPKCLFGDDMRLQQVLINLGGNAIKFTSAGEVVLHLRVVEQTAQDVLVEFAMQDSGIGIAPENHAHIFSGFSQAEASTTRRFGGTGLGLAISSRMVGLLGGTLAVDSVLGQGSRFHFQIRFPLAEMPPADSPAPAIPALGALKTLIVDDNTVARDVLRHTVEAMGWQVDTAASGAEAIAHIEARAAEKKPMYEVIFMDWQMPEMDGWEASQRIRQLATGAITPIVIMVTAHGRELLS